jgi:hypothetical protein
LLVRVAIKQDSSFEDAESFTLRATNASGVAATGIATIRDGGSGALFGSANNTGIPDLIGTSVDASLPAALDNDRPVSGSIIVSGSTVREPSAIEQGYLIFNVSGIEGQPIALSLQSGTATLGTDTGSGSGPGLDALEIWDPVSRAWVAYNPLSLPVIPKVGDLIDGDAGILTVRIAVKSDNVSDSGETLTLMATPQGGAQSSAIGTIIEGSSAPLIADAAPIVVTGQIDNEFSGVLNFIVTGRQGEAVQLQLASTGSGNGHADPNTDVTEQCFLAPTTLQLLSNDLAKSGQTLNPGSVKLFTAAIGGSGVSMLTIAGQGTYTVSNAGAVTFTPVDSLPSNTVLTPIFYSVLDSNNNESNRSEINFNSGATSAPNAISDGNPVAGRYVRISITNNWLQLAEVEVFSGGINIAQGKTAIQSSTDFGGVPGRAVDGNTNGNYGAGSVTHTAFEAAPFWQVDLGSEQFIETIKIYSREDGDYSDLNNAAVQLLDASNNVVSSYSLGTAVSVNTKQFPSATPISANDGAPAIELCSTLEYFDGTSWVGFTAGSSVVIPGSAVGAPGTLRVRARLAQDANIEGAETLNLIATRAGFQASGTGTIVDFGMEPVTVNEASPYIVFTVIGVPGAGISLAFSDGSAEPADHGTDLEFFDTGTSAWVAYSVGSPNAFIQNDGRLLVRVALVNDAIAEGLETFNLTATYNGNGSPAVPIVNGSSITGTATIADNGSGVIFLSRKDNPLTALDDSDLGVNDNNRPQFDNATALNNDYAPVAVNDAFILAPDGTAGPLDLLGNDVDGNGDALSIVSIGGVLRIPGSAQTIDVTNGTVTISSTGQINFARSLAYTGAVSFDYVISDGTYEDSGVVYLDDLRVDDVTVNEGSPYVIFTVRGPEQLPVSLMLSGASGDLPLEASGGAADLGLSPSIEYLSGGIWNDYDPLSLPQIQAGGSLLVRVDISKEQDTDLDGLESFRLIATSSSNVSSSGGLATINDSNSGAYFASDNTTGISSIPTGIQLDDDRPLTVTSHTINEASPYGVFTVSGAPNQKFTLKLDNVSTGLSRPAEANSFSLSTSELLVYGEYEFAMESQLPGDRTVISFNQAQLNTASPISQDIILNGEVLGQVVLTQSDPGLPAQSRWNAWGGAGITKPDVSFPGGTRGSTDQYINLYNDFGHSLVVNLTEAQSYLGFWWTGETWYDGGGRSVRFYYQNVLVATLNTSQLIADDGNGVSQVLPSVYRGNPNTGPTDNTQRNKDSYFAFLNIFTQPGQVFDKVVFDAPNGSFRIDNLTFGNIAAPDSVNLSGLEVYDANTSLWSSYQENSPVELDASGKRLVRTRITPEQEDALDTGETFTISAFNTGSPTEANPAAIGIGTVVDNGTGSLYSSGNTSGQPELPGANGLPNALDDDVRPLSVTAAGSVNERSQYAFFTVSGSIGQSLSLVLGNTPETSEGLACLHLERDKRTATRCSGQWCRQCTCQYRH